MREGGKESGGRREGGRNAQPTHAFSPTPLHPHRPGDDSATLTFVCERVCTSKRLLRRMGGLAKDPTPGTCVTVCGAARADACSEACQRAVCANLHQVPAWNDACMRRCESECLKAVDGR